jgi:16S rRNA (cytosine967-C5)-methyltransferase
LTPRATAAEIITTWLNTGQFPDRLLPETADSRAFIMGMVYGVVRQRRALEWLADTLSDRTPAPDTLPFLFVGLYQLLFMDDIEPYAAVDETVKAAKAGPVPRAAGFINAILRRASREKAHLLESLAEQSMAIRLSHPDILVDRWRNALGDKETEALCRWNNDIPDVIIRPNLARAAFDSYRAALAAEGINADPHPYAPDEFLVLPHGFRVQDLPGFADGFFTVQDPATMACVRLLCPEPGDNVLDACAAPGGKTALIVEKLAGKGSVVAADLHADRLDLLRDTACRMDWQNVNIIRADATRIASADGVGDRQFDRILLDVPCSNTGVIRRRPDARWRFSAERLEKMRKTQRRIMDSSATLLRPGGRLVYSTCSLEPEENADMIASWLAENTGFLMLDSVQLWPTRSGTDGAYAAAVERRA